MEDALLQPLPVHGEGQGAPHVAVPEDGVGPRRVAVGGQVEGEVAVRGASVRIDRELRCGAGPLHVGGRSQELEGVRLPGDELREGGLGIRREPPDQPPDVGPAEEKRRVGDELDTFPGLPRDEAVRPVAHRRPAERRAHPLVAGDAREQVGRQDAHVVHGVEEHLGVAAAEPEDRGERVSRHRGHRPDGTQCFARGGVDARVGVRRRGATGDGRQRRIRASPDRAQDLVAVGERRRGLAPGKVDLHGRVRDADRARRSGRESGRRCERCCRDRLRAAGCRLHIARRRWSHREQ